MIPINHQLKQYAMQHSVLGMSLLLGILIICTFFYSAKTWQQDWKITHSISTTDAPIKNDNLVKKLPEMHLFGKTFSETGYVPISNLQLHVTGIVKTTDEEGSGSKVYISIEGQPSKIYQAGDSLPYGVKIYSITADTVVLENNGQLEKLFLSREKLQFKSRDEG